MKPHIWMLVADGGVARLYRNTGNNEPHTAKLELVLDGEFLREKTELGKIWFGRSFFTALGRAPHGVNTHEDKKRLLDVKFLRGVVDWLTNFERQSKFEQLIIAAPSRALGELRGALTPSLKTKTICEINADLTKTPIKLIEERFKNAVSVNRNSNVL
jgi:protein required for attachment to host cells